MTRRAHQFPQQARRVAGGQDAFAGPPWPSSGQTPTSPVQWVTGGCLVLIRYFGERQAVLVPVLQHTRGFETRMARGTKRRELWSGESRGHAQQGKESDWVSYLSKLTSSMPAFSWLIRNSGVSSRRMQSLSSVSVQSWKVFRTSSSMA